MDYTSVFKGAENAKALGGFASRLPIGEHTVLLTRFGVKESAKGKGRHVEADFEVVESSTLRVGESRGWAWFISNPGFSGQYEESRLKDFIETIATSIGDTSAISAIGAALAGPQQAGVGLKLRASVKSQTDSAGNPKIGPKGTAYTEIKWLPVTQGPEDIAAARVYLEKSSAPATGLSATTAAPVAPPADVPAATNPGMSSLLASLKR